MRDASLERSTSFPRLCWIHIGQVQVDTVARSMGRRSTQCYYTSPQHKCIHLLTDCNNTECYYTGMSRPTQPSTLHGMVKWISAVRQSNTTWRSRRQQRRGRFAIQVRWLGLKPGFHYPSSRAELTARELGCIFWHPSWRVSKNAPEFTARELGPWTRVVETGLKAQQLLVLFYIHQMNSHNDYVMATVS